MSGRGGRSHTKEREVLTTDSGPETAYSGYEQTLGNQAACEALYADDSAANQTGSLDLFLSDPGTCLVGPAQRLLIDDVVAMGAEPLARLRADEEKDSAANHALMEATRPGIEGSRAGKSQGIGTSGQRTMGREGRAAGPVLQPSEHQDGSVDMERSPDGYGKAITLTFDDGPDVINGSTSQILDTLLYYKEARGVEIRATFFVASERFTEPQKYGLSETEAGQAEDLLQRMHDEGHIVANHAIEHKLDVQPKGAPADAFPDHLTSTHDAETTEALIDPYQDPFTPSYFRFPGGAADQESIANLEERELASVGWNINSADYNYVGETPNQDAAYDGASVDHVRTGDLSDLETPDSSIEHTYQRDLARQRDADQGGIVLMHDGFAEIPTDQERSTYDALGVLENGQLPMTNGEIDPNTQAKIDEEQQQNKDARRAFAQTHGRGFSARMLRAFIEDSLDQGYTFVGLDNEEAFPAVNAYARAVDPMPFVRREIFEALTDAQALFADELASGKLDPYREGELEHLAAFDLSWETADSFAHLAQSYLGLTDDCSLDWIQECAL